MQVNNQDLHQKLNQTREKFKRERQALKDTTNMQWNRCSDTEELIEVIEAFKMEKEDAYNKIAILEDELDQIRFKVQQDLGDDTNQYNIDIQLNKKLENQGVNILKEQMSCPDLQDAEVYKRYREFKQKFDSK